MGGAVGGVAWLGMRRLTLVLALLAVPVLALAQASMTGERPDCVRASAVARFGAMAYDHWVHVENTCPTTVHCTVFTDVNPVPVDLDLANGASRDVATFHGSPASAFTATVNCSR